MARRRRRRRRSRRERRIWLSVLVTVAGLLVLTILGVWIERRRDTDLKDPGAGVTTDFQHRSPTSAPELTFRDVSRQVGLRMRHGPGPRTRTLPEDTGSGLAWRDYDGDGDPDLYVVSFGGPLGEEPDPSGSNRLYRNDGGRLVDVTGRAGVGDLEGFGMGARFADFDGDGDEDLYVTNRGFNRLFRNLGDGTFRDDAATLGVDDSRWSIAGAWGDLNRDGLLDLYVTNYVDFDVQGDAGLVSSSNDPNWQGVPFTLNPNSFDPQPNALFLQGPDGRFRDAALEAGASNPEGRSLAVSMVDVDGDGWLDLYVANDVSANVLLKNRGADLDAALFEDIAPGTGTADPRGSMGISVADLSRDTEDPDGRPDLFVSHWVAQENALYQSVGGDGELEYRDRVRQLRMAEISTDRVGWGTAFTDLDLDGRPDLVVANGSTLERDDDPTRLQAQRMFVLWNDGRRFHDVTGSWGEDLEEPRVARGLACADFDGDGDPDLAVSVNRGSPLLLANEGPPRGRWLEVRWRGPAAAGPGARVDVRSGGRWQRRWLGADVSFASQHAGPSRFGLGEATVVTVEVTPLAARRQRFLDLPADSRIVVSGPMAGDVAEPRSPMKSTDRGRSTP